MSINDEVWEEQITLLNENVNDYYKLDANHDGDGLNRVMQEIGARLYYLSTIRAEFYALYEGKKKDLMDAGMSAVKAQNECDVIYPAMYKLRKLLDAAQRIHTACSVHISYIKNEKRNH